MALCYGCHSYIDGRPFEKIKIFEQKVGEERVQELRILSKQPHRNWKKKQKDISKYFRDKFRYINEDKGSN